MARSTFGELWERRLDLMSADERAGFDAALAVARLAVEVGEKVRDAREAAGLTQRDLALVCRRARRRLPALRPAVRGPRWRLCTRPRQLSA